MKLKKFILDLPGNLSYCNCEKLCSRIEIEHVYPKKLLRKKLSSKWFNVAESDPHNLYRCCLFLNRKKGDLLFAKEYNVGEYSGMLARSCLYMNFTYGLETEQPILKMWTNYSLMYPPFPFEIERCEIIKKHFRKDNPFIQKFKD